MTYVNRTEKEECMWCNGLGRVKAKNPEKPWQKPTMKTCEECHGDGGKGVTEFVDINELSTKEGIEEICNVLDDILERLEKLETVQVTAQ